MKRALLIIALGLAGLVAAVAQAQVPSGIARPPNEARLSDVELGSQLYAGNCAVCHGVDGEGVPRPLRGTGDIEGQGPSLRGVGAQAADFYIRTGYMPLTSPREQPWRKRVLFTRREQRALVDYVASLGAGPPIPKPAPQTGTAAEGLRLFTQHCSGCHQVVAEGGYVTNARVPAIKQATPTQVAEAVRIGPYLMPKFSKTAISDRQLNSIIRYIEVSKHPDDRGGIGLGNTGPVPEGIVAWFVGAALLVALCAVIGEWLRRA